MKVRYTPEDSEGLRKQDPHAQYARLDLEPESEEDRVIIAALVCDLRAHQYTAGKASVQLPLVHR